MRHIGPDHHKQYGDAIVTNTDTAEIKTKRLTHIEAMLGYREELLTLVGANV